MLDALTLDQMRVFVVVAETGSFRQAASRLARVQSAVSHAIGNIEAGLGVRLFDRSGHRPVMTPEGQALLADARAILLKVGALKARARGMGKGVELGLSVAVDPLVAPTVMAELLAKVYAAYPTVAIRLVPAPLGAALGAVRDGTCDLAVTTGSFGHAEVEREMLPVGVPFVAVVGSRHPLAALCQSRVPLSTVELADHVQVVVEDPTEITFGQDFGVMSPSTWRVGDLATKHALILAGIGWGRLPLWMVERDLDERRLVRVATGEFGPEAQSLLEVFLLRRNDQALGPATALLRKLLLSEAPRMVG